MTDHATLYAWLTAYVYPAAHWPWLSVIVLAAAVLQQHVLFPDKEKVTSAR